MKDVNLDNGIMAEYIIGSHLYGTNIENSDMDYCGIFIPTIEYYFGLENVKEVNRSILAKHENGKNTKDAIDRKFYELTNFVRMAIDNNPNIVEQLFVNDFVFIDDRIKPLFDSRHMFIHQGLYHRFLGYAYSQKKKMIVKLDNMDKIIDVKNILANGDPTDTVLHLKDKLKNHLTDDLKFLVVGDIKLDTNQLVKKALKSINNRFSQLSNRVELVLKHGFDVKFASHLIRLVTEGIELLNSGNIMFPLAQRDLIIAIKNGKYKLNEILDMLDGLENDIKIAKNQTDLPKHPDRNKINKMLIKILTEFHFGKETVIK